ncbi:MAG: hypothetical protein WD577_01170 [Bacteroidales bacterium]
MSAYNVIQKLCFTALLLVISFALYSQTDYHWWNKKHDYDGSKSWIEYLILSPAYMGPNALPIPEMYSGNIPAGHHIETGLEGHYSKGDQTANLYLSYNFPLFSDRASMQVSYRPVEIYRTDTITRDLRSSRELEPEGYSFGDIYVTTCVQLIRDHDRLPDLMISANIKTASGTNLDGARHTDTPGYWFDATLGKRINTMGNKIQYHQLYGKAGFYSYQTYTKNRYQNDAFLYGAGILTAFRKINIQHQLTGFAGYFNNGDRPLAYRFIIENRTTGKTGYRLMYQQGLHDLNYSTVRCTISFNLN